MGLRTRILRHPALREFYRNYRVLLTFRGFLLAAAATTLYLLIANTLGLEQLQELEAVQDPEERARGSGEADACADCRGGWVKYRLSDVG